MIRFTARGVPIADRETGLRRRGGVGPHDDDLAETTAAIGRGDRRPAGVGALVSSGVERPPPRPLGVGGMDNSSGSEDAIIALWSMVWSILNSFLPLHTGVERGTLGKTREFVQLQCIIISLDFRRSVECGVEGSWQWSFLTGQDFKKACRFSCVALLTSLFGCGPSLCPGINLFFL